MSDTVSTTLRNDARGDAAALFQHGHDFSGDAITPGSLSIGLLLALAQAFYLKTNRPVLYIGLNSNLERFNTADATN